MKKRSSIPLEKRIGTRAFVELDLPNFSVRGMYRVHDRPTAASRRLGEVVSKFYDAVVALWIVREHQDASLELFNITA